MWQLTHLQPGLTLNGKRLKGVGIPNETSPGLCFSGGESEAQKGSGGEWDSNAGLQCQGQSRKGMLML